MRWRCVLSLDIRIVTDRGSREVRVHGVVLIATSPCLNEYQAVAMCAESAEVAFRAVELSLSSVRPDWAVSIEDVDELHNGYLLSQEGLDWLDEFMSAWVGHWSIAFYEML